MRMNILHRQWIGQCGRKDERMKGEEGRRGGGEEGRKEGGR